MLKIFLSIFALFFIFVCLVLLIIWIVERYRKWKREDEGTVRID